MQKTALLVMAALLLMPMGASAQSEPVSMLDLSVNLQEGQEKAETGVPISLQLSLRANEPSSIAYIFQVKDPDGYTAHISWETATLAAGENKAFESLWLPEKDGMHTVEAFVWEDALSPVALSTDVPRLGLDVEQVFSVTYCVGTAECFTGTVTKIVDGDTLDVGGTRIRLALVNTPESNEQGFSEATAFTSLVCPVGSTVLVDEDDGQTSGSFGRMVAKVFCDGRILNAELLYAGHAEMYTQFCGVSEFGSESWA
ncbi:MAG TPA: thermonuclease family protein, partial [Nitrososphaera sp.]